MQVLFGEKMLLVIQTFGSYVRTLLDENDPTIFVREDVIKQKQQMISGTNKPMGCLKALLRFYILIYRVVFVTCSNKKRYKYKYLKI